MTAAAATRIAVGLDEWLELQLSRSINGCGKGDDDRAAAALRHVSDELDRFHRRQCRVAQVDWLHAAVLRQLQAKNWLRLDSEQQAALLRALVELRPHLSSGDAIVEVSLLLTRTLLGASWSDSCGFETESARERVSPALAPVGNIILTELFSLKFEQRSWRRWSHLLQQSIWWLSQTLPVLGPDTWQNLGQTLSRSLMRTPAQSWCALMLLLQSMGCVSLNRRHIIEPLEDQLVAWNTALSELLEKHVLGLLPRALQSESIAIQRAAVRIVRYALKLSSNRIPAVACKRMEWHSILLNRLKSTHGAQAQSVICALRSLVRVEAQMPDLTIQTLYIRETIETLLEWLSSETDRKIRVTAVRCLASYAIFGAPRGAIDQSLWRRLHQARNEAAELIRRIESAHATLSLPWLAAELLAWSSVDAAMLSQYTVPSPDAAAAPDRNTETEPASSIIRETMTTWHLIAQWCQQKQPVLALCAHALSIATETGQSSRDAQETPSTSPLRTQGLPLDQTVAWMRQARRALRLDSTSSAISRGQDGVLALVTCPLDACDADDVSHACINAACVLYRWCVRHASTAAVRHACAEAWLAFSTLDLECFIEERKKSVQEASVPLREDDRREWWRSVRLLAKNARQQLQATDSPSAVDDLWQVMRTTVLPGVLERLEQVSRSVPLYADGVDGSSSFAWPAATTSRHWLRHLRQYFGALIASMPLATASLSTWATAALLCVHPLGSERAVRWLRAALRLHAPDLSQVDLIAEMLAIVDSMDSKSMSRVALPVDAVALLRKAIVTWTRIWPEDKRTTDHALESLSKTVFVRLVLPVLEEIWRTDWTRDDFQLVRELELPEAPTAPSEPIRSSQKERALSETAVSSRARQLQQAERDRYQAARRLYEEQLLAYQERKSRYELLKGQQHRLHLALAGVWAGLCELMAAVQVNATNRSFCDLLLGSMEAVHRLTEHMHWRRGQETWRALLKLAQTMSVVSPDAADELDSGTQMRSLAGLLSASRCDWLDQFDLQPTECSILGQFKLSFIRNQIQTMEMKRSSGQLPFTSSPLLLEPWLLLAESVAFDPETRWDALPVLVPLYSFVVEQIERHPDDDRFIGCAWRSFMQSVLASFLAGRRARLEVNSDTYEAVETMLLQLSHCWHRQELSHFSDSGHSGTRPAGLVLEALPIETENKLSEHLRELASKARQGRRRTIPMLAEQTSALFWHWQNVLCHLLPFPWLDPDLLVHRSLLELVPTLISMDASIRLMGVRVARQMPPAWLGQSTVWCLALTLACHDRHRDVAANARQLVQEPVYDITRLALWLDHVYAPIRQAAAEAIAEAVAKAPDSASLLRQWLPIWFARFPKFAGPETKTANEGSSVRHSDSATTAPALDLADGLSHVLLALAQRGERPVTVELLPMIFAFLCARGWTCADMVIRQRLRQAAICFIECQGPAAVPVLLSLLTSALENPLDDLEVSLQDSRQESLILVLGALALHIPSDELAVLCQAADRLVRMALATPAADVQQAAADVLTQLIPRWNQVDPKAVKERLDNWLDIALSSSDYGQRRGAALLWAAALYAVGGASAWNGSVAAQRVTDILSDRNAPLEARLGALALLEALALRLQSAYVPIGVQMLPLLLQASGDNTTSVRQSSADAARALMRFLSAAEMPTVLHSLLEQLDNDSTSWRTRMASLDLLGSMANMGPEQLAHALPEIVPRLVSALTDVHPRVQETAAQALSQMAELATRPACTTLADDSEAAADQTALARSLSKRLVQALGHPEQYLLPVLYELRQSLQRTLLVIGDMGSTSTQLLDALLLPLLRRALSHRQLAVRQEALFVLLERTRTRDRGADGPTAVPGIPPGSLILARLKEDLVSMILRDSIPEHRYRAALVLRELMRPLLPNSLEAFWSSLPGESACLGGSRWSASSAPGQPADTSLCSSAASAATNMNRADELQLSMELWNRLISELFAGRNGLTERSGAAEAIASLASLHWQRTRAETPTTPYGEIDPAIDRLLRALIWDVLEPSAGLEAGSSVSRESALLVVGALARHEIPLYKHKSLWQVVLDASRDVQDAVRQAALGAGEALIDAAKRQIGQTCTARHAIEVVSRAAVPAGERRDRTDGTPAQAHLLQCWFAAPCWQALEEGLFARHWRVRLACIQLGESAMRRQELSGPLSGASGPGTTLDAPMSQESGGDERLPLAPPMETGRGPARSGALDGLASVDPGDVLYQFRPIFLARLYILRFDPSASIQSHASTLWKKWVPNAARTLHVLALQVRKEALACLRGLDNATNATVDGDLVLATQGALADMCSKLGADVAAAVISELQTLVGNDGAEHGTECAIAAANALEQIGQALPHALREQVARPYLLNAVRQCLERDEEELEAVRHAGGALLALLLPILGEQVLVAEVVQPLWERFEAESPTVHKTAGMDTRLVAAGANGLATGGSRRAARGLTQALTLRAVGERLQHRLLPWWLESGRWQALETIISLVDTGLVQTLVPLILARLFELPPAEDSATAPDEAIDSVFGSDLATRVAMALAEHLPAAVLPLALEYLGASDPLKRRRAISLLRFVFGRDTNASVDSGNQIASVNSARIRQMYELLTNALADPDRFVVEQASIVWQQSVQQLPTALLVSAVAPVRETLLAIGDPSSSTSNDTSSISIPGLVLEPFSERGITPVLILYQYGLTAPETRPEIREQAALGIAQVVRRVPQAVVQPHALRVMGLVIRLLSDRQTHWPVTVALLQALASFWSRAGANARALAPALQSVLFRYLRDPQRLVRQASVEALVPLLLDHPRPEAALTELVRLTQAGDASPGQRLAAMECLTKLLNEAARRGCRRKLRDDGALSTAPGALDQVLAPSSWPWRLHEAVVAGLGSALDAERACAAQLFAAMQRYWDIDPGLKAQLVQALMHRPDRDAHTGGIAWQHGQLLAIQALLLDAEIGLSDSVLDEMETYARAALASEAAPLRKAAIQVLGALATRIEADGSAKHAEWLRLLAERLNEDTFSEVREAALQALGTVGALASVLPLLLQWSYQRSGQRAPGLRTAALEALQQRLVDATIPAVRWDVLREAQQIVHRSGDPAAPSIEGWLEHLALNSVTADLRPRP